MEDVTRLFFHVWRQEYPVIYDGTVRTIATTLIVWPVSSSSCCCDCGSIRYHHQIGSPVMAVAKGTARLFQHLACFSCCFLTDSQQPLISQTRGKLLNHLFYFAIELGGCVIFNTSHNSECLLGYYIEHYFPNGS